MDGCVNAAFVNVPDDSQLQPENGQTLPGEYTNAAEPAKSVDPFSRGLVRVRSLAYDLLTSQPKLYSIGLPVALHGVSIAYLIGALVYHFNKENTHIDWCNNIGLLIIVDAIIYGTLFYYFIKLYVWQHLESLLFTPISASCSAYVAKRPTLERFCAISGRYLLCLIYLLPVIGVGVFLGVDVRSGEEKRLISLLGVVIFMLFGFLFSKYPGHIRWRPVFSGLLLQYIFGLMTVRWDVGRNVMSCLGDKVTLFQSYTTNGTEFVYGSLITNPDNGNIFAFATLSVIFFFSFVINILSYYGALQWFIMQLGWLIQTFMGTTVCESVNAAACIFLGMTESPLLFRSYIPILTKSELHAVMCAGWATIAGTVMAAYIAFGVDPAHLIAATLMSAPASLCYAKLWYPETEVSRNTVDNIVLEKEQASNVLDAACKGAIAATELVFGIIANIIAFLAFVSFLDGLINWVGVQVGADELSFQFLLSKIFIPISFLMGVDDESLEDVARLVGTKTVINEFKAYQLMTDMVKLGKLSKRTEAITTYALCGFSNFSSIGILIGGLSALAPTQRANITDVALRGFIAANIVCFLTAAIAGTLISSDQLTETPV